MALVKYFGVPGHGGSFESTCRTCRNRVGHYSSQFACSVHLDYRRLGVPFDCDNHQPIVFVPDRRCSSSHVVGSTARTERSEGGRNGSTTFNLNYRFNQAKTSLKGFRFGFFFARFKKVVFFICRVVARQMTVFEDSRTIKTGVKNG